MKTFIYTALIIFLLISCNKQADKDIANKTEREFVDVSGIDSTIKPGDNFFRRVNGKWYDTVKIDSDQVGVGSYRFLNIPQKKLLQNILEEVSSAQHQEGSIEQKVGDFYASGMDTVAINQRGYKPIEPLLDQIEAISNITELMAFVADELQSGNSSIVAGYISPDNDNSNINMVHVVQTGLGLP
ncbi:MAG: M13 family metallopeptidase N-terminal domain-containing protein, partial [Flavobacteriaceae bacterium]